MWYGMELVDLGGRSSHLPRFHVRSLVLDMGVYLFFKQRIE